MKKTALALISMLVLGLASPAMAQTGAGAKINSPGEGAALSGSVSVSGTSTASTGVRTAKLFIDDNLVASASPSNLRTTVDLNYSWDTTQAFGGGISRNGWHQIRVETTATGGGSSTSKISVMVDNAAQAPSGLDGYVQDTTASLSWSPNPEPDIAAYRIEIGNAGSWSTATETTGTSHTFSLQPGTYDFRVVALRSSPSLPNGRPSAPSAPVTLTIQSPEAVGGSTGGTGGGTSGGGRGAVGGGDPRVYGRDGAASTRDVKDTARAFSSGGLSFGGISLPGQAGLPDLPGTQPFEWGTYKERLPYSLPQGGIPLDAAPPRLAALSTTKIIPMDALRWVGAGALMIVLAVFLQFFGWRAETIAKLGAEGAAALKLSFPKIAKPAVSFSDAHVRLRRIQDRVRATWTKARGS